LNVIPNPKPKISVERLRQNNKIKNASLVAYLAAMLASHRTVTTAWTQTFKN
jgi:hypothetical protein